LDSSVLGTDFYNDATVSQPNVLLHEALHVALEGWVVQAMWI